MLVPLAPQVAAEVGVCEELLALAKLAEANLKIDDEGCVNNKDGEADPRMARDCMRLRQSRMKQELATCRTNIQEMVSTVNIWDLRDPSTIAREAMRLTDNYYEASKTRSTRSPNVTEPQVDQRTEVGEGRQRRSPVLFTLLKLGFPAVAAGLKAIRYAARRRGVARKARSYAKKIAGAALAGYGFKKAADIMRRKRAFEGKSPSETEWLQIKPLWSSMVTRVLALARTTTQASKHLSTGVENLLSRRLSPELIKPAAIRAAYEEIIVKSAAKGLILLSKDALNIYDLPVSHKYVQDLMALNVTVWLDAQLGGSGATLYKVRSLPIILDKELALDLVLENEILQVSENKKSVSSMKASDLAACARTGSLFTCSESRAVARVETGDCLAALYGENWDTVRGSCRFTVSQRRSRVMRIGDSNYLLHTDGKDRIAHSCPEQGKNAKDRTWAQSVGRGLWEVEVGSTCVIKTKAYEITALTDVGSTFEGSTTRMTGLFDNKENKPALLKFGQMPSSPKDPLLIGGLTIGEIVDVIWRRSITHGVRWIIGSLVALFLVICCVLAIFACCHHKLVQKMKEYEIRFREMAIKVGGRVARNAPDRIKKIGAVIMRAQPRVKFVGAAIKKKVRTPKHEPEPQGLELQEEDFEEYEEALDRPAARRSSRKDSRRHSKARLESEGFEKTLNEAESDEEDEAEL
jgi:hypothetical protein